MVSNCSGLSKTRMIIRAEELRNTESLSNVSDNLPGYYKWWAERPELDRILSELETEFSEVSSFIERKDNLYCIYVGIAAKESIRKRLNWHVNDRHTPSRVVHGTLSTLRQSISSIVAHNQYNQDATDEFIDKLTVEWFALDDPIKSQTAIDKLHAKEQEIMSEYLCVLNIKDNRFPQARPIKRRLTALRRVSKQL